MTSLKSRKKEGEDVSLSRRMRLIEWLKVELLNSVSALFDSFFRNSKEDSLDALSNLIMVSYLLARRTGISYQRLDRRVDEKIRDNIDSNHPLEDWSGDLTALISFREEQKME